MCSGRVWLWGGGGAGKGGGGGSGGGGVSRLPHNPHQDQEAAPGRPHSTHHPGPYEDAIGPENPHWLMKVAPWWDLSNYNDRERDMMASSEVAEQLIFDMGECVWGDRRMINSPFLITGINIQWYVLIHSILNTLLL